MSWHFGWSSWKVSHFGWSVLALWLECLGTLVGVSWHFGWSVLALWLECLESQPLSVCYISSQGLEVGVASAVINVLECVSSHNYVVSLTQANDVLVTAVLAGRMLMYDGLQGQFRTVKLRPRQKHCVVCGDMPSLTHLLDYPLWCQSCEVGKALLDYKDRISCRDYKTVLDSQQSHLLVDVRGQGEFEICHLQHATSILCVCVCVCVCACVRVCERERERERKCV